MTAFLFLGLLAAQQDRVIAEGERGERILDGRIGEIGCKEVRITTFDNDGRATRQTVPSDTIREIRYDNRSLRQALDFMGRGDLEGAVAALAAVVAAPQPEWIVQPARYYLAQCLDGRGRRAEAVAAMEQLRREAPQGYYFLPAGLWIARTQIAAGQYAQAEAVASSLRDHAAQHGHPGWVYYPDLLDAAAQAAQQRYPDALALYSRLSRVEPKRVREEALSGELRILLATNQTAQAQSRAEQAITEENRTDRERTAAYNALGDVHRAAGREKEALLCYLRGVALYGRTSGRNDDHAVALARAAVQTHRVGQTLPDARKAEYTQRAFSLLQELEANYPGTPLAAEVRQALGVRR